MLGEIWDGSESVIVNEGDKDKNKLRLSLIETLNNPITLHNETVSGFWNLLESCRRDQAINKRELIEAITKLNAEDLYEDVEEELESKARDKRVIIRIHAREIMKLESKITVSVEYRVIKTGYTTLLTPGLTLKHMFLSVLICWSIYRGLSGRGPFVSNNQTQALPHGIPAMSVIAPYSQFSEKLSVLETFLKDVVLKWKKGFQLYDNPEG